MFDEDFKTKADDPETVTVASPRTDASHTDDAPGATPVDLAQMGLDEIAYIREAVVNNEDVWAIFNAAGQPIGAAQTFEQAWGAVRQHDMEPARVH